MKTNITSIINGLLFGAACIVITLLFTGNLGKYNPQLQTQRTTVQTHVYTPDTYIRDTVTMLENGLLPECYE